MIPIHESNACRAGPNKPPKMAPASTRANSCPSVAGGGGFEKETGCANVATGTNTAKLTCAQSLTLNMAVVVACQRLCVPGKDGVKPRATGCKSSGSISVTASVKSAMKVLWQHVHHRPGRLRCRPLLVLPAARRRLPARCPHHHRAPRDRSSIRNHATKRSADQQPPCPA